MLCSPFFYKEHNHPIGALRYFNQPASKEPGSSGATGSDCAKFIDTDLANIRRNPSKPSTP
jgi:hypothetical protein